jgi:hypothetical protein
VPRTKSNVYIAMLSSHYHQLYGLGPTACSISELLLKLQIVSTIVRTPWMRYQNCARPLPIQDNTTQKDTDKHPCLERKSTVFASKLSRPTPQTAQPLGPAIIASDRAATGTGHHRLRPRGHWDRPSSPQTARPLGPAIIASAAV